MTKSGFDLSEAVAIIVGGTKGMGEAISHQFAESGARLIINSRSEDDTHALAEYLNGKFGRGKPIAVGKAGDMSSKADLQGLVDAALDNFGKITSLVYCPSLRPWFGSSIDTPDEEMDKQYLFFFKSKFWISSMCIPHIAAAGGGSIVYIGSGSPFEATSERSLTSCMRAAEVQMMKNFAAEFGSKNIRFNIVAPNMIDTHGAKALFANKEALAHALEGLPMRRSGTTSEISNTVAFLVSDASSYTTGAVIPVDGGRLIHAVPVWMGSSFTKYKAGSSDKKESD